MQSFFSYLLVLCAVQAIYCLQFIEPTCWIKGSWYREGAHVSARASGHFLIGVSLVLL
jgi:hypothetical protein